MKELLKLGIDVGSTTVKAVVMNGSNEILWQDYQRHNAHQAELLREFLINIENKYPNARFKTFITGSGARSLAPLIDAKFIQEVNAVTYAVESLYPDTGSVIELGGQDAKVIIWKEDEHGEKTTTSFMNDKCAGGTGATIDKILAKIGINQEHAVRVNIGDKQLHHVAAKCGVFAETDVVALLKSGVDKEEILVSFFTAVVKQNLEVLVRGSVLRDRVMLLGGPHSYFPVLTDIWREEIPKTWDLHSWQPRQSTLKNLIYVPENSQYFAAIGAVLFGYESESMSESLGLHEEHPDYDGTDKISEYIEGERGKSIAAGAVIKDGLIKGERELENFRKQYELKEFQNVVPAEGEELEVFMGIDGGSTSSKMALIDKDGTLKYKDYVLSEGNPLSDLKQIFTRLKEWQDGHKVSIKFLGTAVTGYAGEILSRAFNLDEKVVETVAHMKSSLFYYGEIDVICDVGGQDIKVLLMKNGRVVDFKLNTQCSAGNGYFLQGMATQFNVDINDYADMAFKARQAPSFNYGCAVFMEQDKVNFQQLGWKKYEIMAGLALVLPLNIWNYVVQEANISRFGRRFVLQGGTQRNLAAVKAQVDYIKGEIEDAEVIVHKYADICGAIGAAIHARDNRKAEEGSSFIGLTKASGLEFTTKNDESTRCRFCANNCPRIFVDIDSKDGRHVRFISGYACEKGSADNAEHMKEKMQEQNKLLAKMKNLVDESCKSAFKMYEIEAPKQGLLNEKALAMRKEMKLGIPRLLNLFLYAPFFSTYFRALGIENIVFSDYTDNKLWQDGNKWGSIDPCFPAKVAPAHVWNLIDKKGVTHVCSPMITHLQSHLEHTLGENACVIQMGTPEVVEAAFTKDADHFKKRGVRYYKPLIRMDRPKEAEANLFEYFKDELMLTEKENAFAVTEAYKAQNEYDSSKQEKGRELINELVDNDKIGILALGHPYHDDPGLNHEIPQEFQKLGFPVLNIESLPADEDFLRLLFSEEEMNAKDVSAVWRRRFNRNTNHKVWAAIVAARHPNLAVVDFSSFKCGFDAPLYSYIDNILEASRTPHFLFHDLDQNKQYASQRIRIQTIEYFLRLEEEKLKRHIAEGVK